jgi:S-DNA-T family DNA segregation ATPase FtsK/SpoIIIE
VGINKTAQNRFRSLFILFSCFTSCFYFFFIHGQEDQSAVSELTNRSETVQIGWVNLVLLSDLIVYKGFGLASFLFVRLFFLTGIFLILDISANRLKGIWFWDLFAIIVLSVLFGFATSVPELGGTVGYELNLFLQDYIGKTGTL